MKFIQSIIILSLSVLFISDGLAHSNRLHKNRFEIMQERAERQEARQLLNNNIFTRQIEKLTALQEKINSQQDPAVKLQYILRYQSELLKSMKSMQELIYNNGGASSNIVVTHRGKSLPIAYQLNMIEKLMEHSMKLQALMADQLKHLLEASPTIQ